MSESVGLVDERRFDPPWERAPGVLRNPRFNGRPAAWFLYTAQLPENPDAGPAPRREGVMTPLHVPLVALGMPVPMKGGWCA